MGVHSCAFVTTNTFGVASWWHFEKCVKLVLRSNISMECVDDVLRHDVVTSWFVAQNKLQTFSRRKLQKQLPSVTYTIQNFCYFGFIPILPLQCFFTLCHVFRQQQHPGATYLTRMYHSLWVTHEHEKCDDHFIIILQTSPVCRGPWTHSQIQGVSSRCVESLHRRFRLNRWIVIFISLKLYVSERNTLYNLHHVFVCG